MAKESFVIIGAGPAGLTAAYELTRHGVAPLVLEAAGKVGGIARTENYKGHLFDMGGHRFFTKSPLVQRIWREMLAEDLLRRPRLSRIYYRQRFFPYPLKALETLRGLGFIESCCIVASSLRWTLWPYPREDTFEQWVTNRFGRRLFRIFFKDYTEKVWGISCSELKAEWAAQRIKDLSLRKAIQAMFLRPGNGRRAITTLIEEFEYPRRGPGMLWETMRHRIEDRGARVLLGSEVAAIHREGEVLTGVSIVNNGDLRRIEAENFISSMPITQLVARLDPPAPQEVRRAAASLRYRDFITVCLIVNRAQVFPDNWIYIHEPGVKVGRIQNFKNWSPDMVPDPATTSSLGMEYFCTEGDALWTMPDGQLIELARRELEQIGLARSADVVDGCVFRVPKSYPMYDSACAENLQVVRQFVDGLTNCRTVGRNGLHRYNNQDHSMLTGIYAARSLLLGEQHDLWAVNAEMDYHEELNGRVAGPRVERSEDVLGVVAAQP